MGVPTASPSAISNSLASRTGAGAGGAFRRLVVLPCRLLVLVLVALGCWGMFVFRRRRGGWLLDAVDVDGRLLPLTLSSDCGGGVGESSTMGDRVFMILEQIRDLMLTTRRPGTGNGLKGVPRRRTEGVVCMYLCVELPRSKEKKRKQSGLDPAKRGGERGEGWVYSSALSLCRQQSRLIQTPYVVRR
jgi:hypothetical protein